MFGVLKYHVEVLKCHVEVVKCHVGVLRCHAKTCHDVDMGFLQNLMLGAGTCMLASVTCMLRITAPFPDVRHGMSSEHINTEALWFKRIAFYNGLKSKVGLEAAKAAALWVNLNIQGCSIVAPPMHAPSRTPLLIPLLLSHNLPTPRVR